MFDALLTIAQGAWAPRSMMAATAPIAPSAAADYDYSVWLASLLRPPCWAAAWAAPELSTRTSDILGQAGYTAFVSGLRYWHRLAAIYGTAGFLSAGLALTATASLTEPERRRLIDALRELARELGEAASQEARRFQAELDRLALRLATQSGAATDLAPRRYARAKP